MPKQHEVDVLTIDTPDLGDRSYLVTDGDVAAVVDPQRDVDRILEVAQRRGVRITHVLETHVHNDYVSGGLELAHRTGALYGVASAEEVDFDHHGIVPGEALAVGRFSVTAIATPGHTPHHLSYAIEVGDRVVGVLTGGSLLYGTVGRTDLVARDMTEPLARAQYRSAHRLAEELPETASVYPTHGFGSFCAASRDDGTSSGTIGDERRRNEALRADDEHRFVADLLASYVDHPRYYAHMGPTNRRGPEPIDLSLPARADASELRERTAAGDWVLDLSERRSYARAHRRGTVNFECCEHLATYVGWVLPWNAELTLLGSSEEQVRDARRALARIGFDRITGWASGADVAGDDVSSYRVADFGDLAAARGRDDVVVLDVRRDDEWREGHVPDAVHIHLPDLPDRVGEVSPGEVWVHCAGGFRAAVAASILDRAGREVVLVDDVWDRAAEQGVEVVPGDAVAA